MKPDWNIPITYDYTPERGFFFFKVLISDYDLVICILIQINLPILHL